MRVGRSGLAGLSQAESVRFREGRRRPERGRGMRRVPGTRARAVAFAMRVDLARDVTPRHPTRLSFEARDTRSRTCGRHALSCQIRARWGGDSRRTAVYHGSEYPTFPGISGVIAGQAGRRRILKTVGCVAQVAGSMLQNGRRGRRGHADGTGLRLAPRTRAFKSTHLPRPRSQFREVRGYGVNDIAS